MQTSLPVALSAQIALEKRLDTLANNIANARTAGFRAEEVKFESFLSRTAREPVAFSSPGEQYLSTRAGELTQTGNALDVAVSGEAFLAVAGSRGTVYTRDGRMRISDAGDLQTLNGEAVLDVGGAPLQVDPAGGPLVIARDGMVSQNGAQVGAIGLFQMTPGTNLSRASTSGVVPDRAPLPVVEFGDTSVVQGFVEGSNVNPILEITRLIDVQRAFEHAATMVAANESSLNDAVTQLGAPA